VAFKNTDGSRVLMLTNSVLSDEDITVTDGKSTFPAVVPGNGVISFVWK
jgi:O-glycosyl hydrolase